ncbi:MAG TPA: signal peptidase II [Clostridiales bacterium]|nr:signal peptidase II [Clostridiales bacterium]
MVYILIVIAFVLAEHKMKDYIEKNRKLGERQEILNGRIIIRKQYNKGAMLNFMDDKKEIVKTVSGACLGLLALLFAVTLPKKGNRVYKLGLSLMLGGAISNVFDRYNRGYVIDYFTINYKKLKSVIFNMADMAIFFGSLFVMLSAVLHPRRHED